MVRQTARTHDTLLVPLDGSPAAEAVLPAAMVLARRLAAEVALLHVLERNAPTRVHGEQHLTDETDAASYLQGIAAQFTAEGIPVTRHVHLVRVGDIPLSIATHAAESGASFILLSVHGTGTPRSWLTGAVAQGVIRHAAPPVLLLRSRTRRRAPFAPEEVVVALDTDRQAEVALPPAARLARSLAIPLRVLLVVPTVETIPGDRVAAARLLPGGATASLDLEAAAAEDYLAQLARRMSDTTGDLQVMTEVGRGDPAQVIIARAQARPSILALATHGRAGFDALWSASVGSRVIARGDGPFLLVHPEPAGAEPLGQDGE
jgi:nucleotide-binding universal stress UspA family protein